MDNPKRDQMQNLGIYRRIILKLDVKPGKSV
jgi:hypothetical protein